MRLSANFTLEELIKSDTALRLGLDNTPPPEVIENLQALTDGLLQPLRDYLKVAIFIRSGYRCLALNRAVQSKDTSQHILGLAVDMEAAGLSNQQLAEVIAREFDFDQLILEYYTPGQPRSGWVHVSRVANPNRHEILTAVRDPDGGTIYTPGLML